MIKFENKIDYVDMSAFSIQNPKTHEVNKVDKFLQSRFEQKEKPEKRLF